ncbi:FAD/NAD(P)-binding domain-containing protein [Rhizodiscina lignyota]|uniref:FAD/NAD(P)-binding domain-containing protein n=1 Tax=Rhizodiscina lignyota TaxID=1504668 RepID=A0A9P4I6J3_9PEZI|nr:FAD/NAD(P)-binding domain-containing protein [Rhizodiscina lignyota]
MSRETTKDIVILGGSFAGISAAHHFLKDTVDKLRVTRTAPSYRVVLISPSTHIYWNIGAPRGIVSPTWLPQNDLFVPIIPAFRRYPINRFHFIQGTATSVDMFARRVHVELHTPRAAGDHKPRGSVDSQNRWSTGSKGSKGSVTQSIEFHALIIATGTYAEDSLYSLHGPHDDTLAALNEFHNAIPNAEGIIVAGGGPSGVETAGQLATYFNRPSRTNRGPITALMNARPKFLKGRLSRHELSTRKPKTITLISGNDRLLPRLPLALGQQAEKSLESLGVHIIHNTRVVSAAQTPGGKMRVVLNNDITITADLYVAATGVRPNTNFLPPEMLDASKYVSTDPNYLRVTRPPPGGMVYCIGDCATYSKNYILDVYEAVPVLMHNLRNDLLVWELRDQNPYGGKEEEIAALQEADMRYVQNPTDSQLMPITRWGGVGVLYGMKLPGWMVYAMKGRDYRIAKAKLVAGQGHNPYAPDTYIYK